MRNDWFPRNIASYITVPELKTLRATNAPMDRNFDFGVSLPTSSTTSDSPTDTRPGAMTSESRIDASMFARKAASTTRITPERSAELVEIFVPARLEFYRQPILEEKEAEQPSPEPKKPLRPLGTGIAADLLAARADRPATVKPAGPQAIYGSVSTADILAAVKAVMAENDEAARVVLHAEDVRFVGLRGEGGETDRVKVVGEFGVEILPRGLEGGEGGVRRVVRVLAQEVA